MTDPAGHGLGQGPLKISTVLRHARGMFALGRSRVALVAMVLFGFPALVTALVEAETETIVAPPGLLTTVAIFGAVGIALVFLLIGPVLFAGYLDEAVGREYFVGHRSTFRDVLRTLPWLRLLLADLIVTVGSTIGLAFFVIPGVLIYMLFGLVGPVIVQEDRGLRDALRRTFRISRTAPGMLLLLVLVPTAFEVVLHEVLLEFAHSAGIGVEVFVEWILAAAVGGAIGLVEVALAAELMARNPEASTQPRS